VTDRPPLNPASAPERPEALPVRFDAIPAELKARPAWFVWTFTRKDGRWTKRPSCVRGGPGSSTDPSTWATFEDAKAAYLAGGWDGVGLVHLPEDGLTGIDLDKCRGPESGTLGPDQAEIVRMLDTYTEVSPSGTGIRAYAFGRKPGTKCKLTKRGYEMYDGMTADGNPGGRFLTITGHRLENSPETINKRQAVIEALYGEWFGTRPEPRAARPTPPAPESVNNGAATRGGLSDDEILCRLGNEDGGKAARLLDGDIIGYASPSEADSALACKIAFYTSDRAQILRLIRGSCLNREKWDRADYADTTIGNAIAFVAERYSPGPRVRFGAVPDAPDGHQAGHPAADQADPEPWESPVPFGLTAVVPDFPTDCLPPVLRDWCVAEAEATQTPPDLAAGLALAVCAAGIAGKVRVRVCDRWAEPLNLFMIGVLPSGDRKTAVFAEATAPVIEYEAVLLEEVRPRVAACESEHRALEARVKHLESRSAKEEEPQERNKLMADAKEAARDLARHVVPALPELLVDDITPEKLAQLLGRQGGRVLQASAEGTAFDIAGGRYSETANFDVYLKGHSGDPLRVGRVGRGPDIVDRPALSVALAVQPDVIAGLAAHAGMRGRGFLARFLYSLPGSLVGRRRTRAAAVPPDVAWGYRETVRRLWAMPGAVDESGKPVPHWLQFSPEADAVLEELEKWLEPQLAEGEPLYHLAGWGSKLAGACARIAGVMQMIETVGAGEQLIPTVPADIARRAVRLGEYYLGHARAAFGLMGADQRIQDARRAVRWLGGHFRDFVKTEKGTPFLTKRDLHVGVWGGSRTVEEVEPVIDLLNKHGYLRPVPTSTRKGPGRHPSPRYEVNPSVAAPEPIAAQTRGPLSHYSQNHAKGVAVNGAAKNGQAKPDDYPHGDAWEGP
jgi:hypothetical protein